MIDSTISMKCLSSSICSHLALFATNRFPAIFGGHFEFLCKMLKCIYLGNGARESDFNKKFLIPREYIWSYLALLFEKVFFRHFWGHFDFLCKTNKQTKTNTFISEMV